MIRARSWAIAIVVLYASSGLVVGSVGGGEYELQVAAVSAITFPLYVFTYLWMKADARERGTASPPGAIPLVVGLFPVAVPYHLVATRRGWRKGLALLLLVFLFAVLEINYLAESFGSWLFA